MTCPQGHTLTESKTVPNKGTLFRFPDTLCASCPLRASCTKSKHHGRVITLHPQEALLQKARAYQKTDAFTEDIKRRQTVEHRIARLKQLGMNKSRFFGKAKTLFQLTITATVANLTLIFNQKQDLKPSAKTPKQANSQTLTLKHLLATQLTFTPQRATA